MPQRDEPHRLFEFLVLEGAQAGLSWSTILAQARGLPRGVRRLRPGAVAAFGDDDVARLLADAGHRPQPGQDRGAVGNARAWLELDDPVEFLWGFVDGGADPEPLAGHGVDVPADDARSRTR